MSPLRVLGIGSLVVVAALTAVALWFHQPILAMADAVGSAFEEPDWADVDTPERVLEFIAAHPNQVSYVLATVADDGTLDVETVRTHNPDTPRPLASTMKIVVLSALARAIDEGALHADDPVELDDWDSWYLMGTDGGAHPNAYDELGIAHTNGNADDPTATVALSVVADAMIHHSDNAATDVVLDRLGDRMEAELVLLRATGGIHDPIRPVLEAWITMYTGNKPDVSSRAKRHVVRTASLPTVKMTSQRAWMANHLPKSTTATYAALMARVATRTHISESASDFMTERLDWPMDGGIASTYDQVCTKGGSVPGVMTEATFTVAKKGDHAGELRVMALFFDELSGSAWLTMMGSLPQQQLALRAMASSSHEDALVAATSR